MPKISEFAEATSIAADDLLVFVDIDDTSMAASGTTKKIKSSNAFPAGTVVKEEIARVSLNGTTGVNFTSIPQTYDRLIVQGRLRADNAATLGALLLKINSAAAGDHHAQRIGAINGSTRINEYDDTVSNLVGDSSPADVYAQVQSTFEGYARTDMTKTWMTTIGYEYDTDNRADSTMTFGTLRNATAAITSIQYNNTADANLFGYLILYGERTIQ